MNIACTYTLTLDEWLEAARAHRSPIQIGKRRSSLLMVTWFLLPLLLPVVLVLLNIGSAPSPAPGQPRQQGADSSLLGMVMPQVLTGYFIATVILLSGPTARKTALWQAGIFVVAAITLAIYVAYVERPSSPPRPLPPDRPISAFNLIVPLLPWALMIVGALIAVRGFLNRGPRREWESSPALRNPTTMTASESGLTITQPDRTCQFQWPAFLKFRESKHLFVLYISENGIEVIPRRAFTPDDLAAFTQLLKMKVVPADAISTAFAVVPKSPAPRPIHVQPLESREFI